MERLVQRAGSQTDTSVALYCFNASLYLLRVLKGNTAKKHQDGQMLQGADTKPEPKDPEVSQEPVWAVSRKLKPTLGQDSSVFYALLPVSPQLSHQAQTANCLDLNFVTRVYSAALESLLTKRNSPLTVPMFLSLFSRYPVSAGGASPPLWTPACPRTQLMVPVLPQSLGDL